MEKPRRLFYAFLIITGFLLGSLSWLVYLYLNKLLIIPGILLDINIPLTPATKGVLGRDYKVLVQVDAMPPKGSPVTILHGYLNDTRLFLDPKHNEKFREVVDAWVKRLEGHVIKYSFGTALHVSLWIIRSENESYRVVPDIIINYNPPRALKERIVREISIPPESIERIIIPQNISISLVKSPRKEISSKSTYGMVWYGWELIESYEPEDCEETPILIINNKDSISGLIQGGISIDAEYTVGFYATLAYGINLKSKIDNKDYGSISLTIYKSQDPETKLKASFGRGINVLGDRQRYVYIMAKPVYGLYREVEYRAYGSYIEMRYTGREKIETSIKDVQVESGTIDIVGGIKSGLPSIMDWFFEGTHLNHLYVSNSEILSDGDLDPGEGISLRLIMDTFDVYKIDFGVGIPVGALIAALIASTSLAPIAPVIAGLVISVNYVEEYAWYVGGEVTNHGYDEDLGVGYDVSEDVFIALSNYRYSAQTSTGIKEFDVPAGIYFVFDTQGYRDYGGCPYLYVYDGEGFVNEGLLDIHTHENIDTTYNHTIATMPALVRGRYIFKLVEHFETVSYIDYVKLYAILSNGSLIELSLITALHSVYGDVLPWLLSDDDLHVPCVGGLHTPSGSHEIILEFQALEGLDIMALIFQIQGHNVLKKD